MATKHGGLLATLGRRMLGFSTSSSGCCAAPAAVAEPVKAPEAVKAPETTPAEAGCCAPTCCATADATSGRPSA
jgi:hypothetical protein